MPSEIKGVVEPTRRGPGSPAVTHAKAPQAHIVRPGKHANGENQEGTPAGAENTDARQQGYKDGEKHRAAERSQPYPGRR